MTIRNELRNVAIIAHVDHGKTTLVDEMLKQGGAFRENQTVADRVMDSGDLERERGITILSKNTAVHYGDTKINIVDTPGHADFCGEVERVLKMVNGVLLLVDAFEGPMPQTKYVLKKALELQHKVIVVINKIDRHDARPEEIIDEILELFIELEAGEEQLDVPFVYASGRTGVASMEWDDPGEDLRPLFEAIIKYIPAPVGDEGAPLQMLVSTIDYNEYVGRIAIGKIERGRIVVNQEAALCNDNSGIVGARTRITNLFAFDGLGRSPVAEARVGDIVAVSGIDGIAIGDTICDVEHIEPLPFLKISAPTVAMTFSVNDSPFAGREGKFVTSRHLRARLLRELETDVSLRVEELSPDAFKVSGRGELHLSILIETMRRQGYEFQVSKPIVIMREADGRIEEPVELVMADVPEAFVGTVMEKMGRRRGELVSMTAGKGGMTRLEFRVPSRGLFGYRSEFLTDTKGEGIFNTVLDGYQPLKDDIAGRERGALVACEDGESVAYGLYNAQNRGRLFIGVGVKVYTGMVVGENSRQGDIDLNVCRKKQLTNMRASGSDDALRLTPPSLLSLEQALEWIDDDELLEVTPLSIRLRKRVLDTEQRLRLVSQKKKMAQ